MKVIAYFIIYFFNIFFKDKPYFQSLINITSLDHCYVQENTNVKVGGKAIVLVFDDLKEAYHYNLHIKFNTFYDFHHTIPGLIWEKQVSRQCFIIF